MSNETQSTLIADIQSALEKLGIPITHHDGNGYFEVSEPVAMPSIED